MTSKRIGSMMVAIAFVGAALVLVMPTGSALPDKCSSATVSTGCAHQCTKETNQPEKCETCSYAVAGHCYVDLQVAS